MILTKLISFQRLRYAGLVLGVVYSSVLIAEPKPTKAIKRVVETQRSPSSIADALNWVIDNSGCSICNGYFGQPKKVISTPNPRPVHTMPLHITSNGPTHFEPNGKSELTGGVVVTQPGRRITANKALIYRSAKLGKVTVVTLLGNVHLWQYGRLVVAPYARMDLLTHQITLRHALYHLNLSAGQAWADFPENGAWGSAREIHNPTQDHINARHVTYSTCSPLNRVWWLSMRRLHLYRERGIGVGHQVLLKILHIPLLYTPYLQFPIDKRRTTGFLIPQVNISRSRDHGSGLGLPFYWSIAPDYDMLITPAYNSSRGFELSNLFRYLSRFGQLNFLLGYLPNDSQFGVYRKQAINDASGSSSLAPYVDALQKMHNSRAYFALNGTLQWNDDWKSDVNLNYVTDPYYFRDIRSASSLNSMDSNQLLNQVSLVYSGNHWQWANLLQGYQTLHRIDQFNEAVYNQYRRLPEMDISGTYPGVLHGLGWNIESQVVNFSFPSNGFPTQNNSLPTPNGWRTHLRSGFNYNFNFGGAYIEPKALLDVTNYASDFRQTSSSPARDDFYKTRVMPIVSLDSGLYFDRSFHWGHADYLQTLEPRLFYLFVPYRNQDAYPDYDTQLLPFSVSQLFSLNRFSGFDRLDNANQISMGLTSRVLRRSDGSSIIQADLGIIRYFSAPRVNLPGETMQHEKWSPLVGDVKSALGSRWSWTNSAAWDPELNKMNNATSTLNFNASNNKLFTLGYQYVWAYGRDSLGLRLATQNILGGASWALGQRWNAFGYLSYDINRDRPERYFTGVQYDTCCWALRVMISRQWTGVAPSSTIGHIQNQYSTNYGIELLLKGLAGTSQGSQQISQYLPGYSDVFAGH